jgi:hypothetical protein
MMNRILLYGTNRKFGRKHSETASYVEVTLEPDAKTAALTAKLLRLARGLLVIAMDCGAVIVGPGGKQSQACGII